MNNRIFIFTENQHKCIVRILLDASAHLDIINRYGTSSLHLATERSDKEIISMLRSKNANINIRNTGNLMTPLHFVSQTGNTEIMDLLIERGADINALNKDGNTPLMLALYTNHREAAELLLQNKADQYIKNIEGLTAFVIALSRCRELIPMLTDKGNQV